VAIVLILADEWRRWEKESEEEVRRDNISMWLKY